MDNNTNELKVPGYVWAFETYIESVKNGAFGADALGGEPIPPLEQIAGQLDIDVAPTSSLIRGEGSSLRDLLATYLIPELQHQFEFDVVPYIETLADATDERGFLIGSIPKISKDYSPIFGCILNEKKLECVRRASQIYGPLLGASAINTREFRIVVAQQVLKSDYRRNNRQCNQSLSATAYRLADLSTHFGVNAHGCLLELAVAVFKRNSRSRKISDSIARQLFKSDNKLATEISNIYKELPASPI